MLSSLSLSLAPAPASDLYLIKTRERSFTKVTFHPSDHHRQELARQPKSGSRGLSFRETKINTAYVIVARFLVTLKKKFRRDGRPRTRRSKSHEKEKPHSSQHTWVADPARENYPAAAAAADG